MIRTEAVVDDTGVTTAAAAAAATTATAFDGATAADICIGRVQQRQRRRRRRRLKIVRAQAFVTSKRGAVARVERHRDARIDQRHLRTALRTADHPNTTETRPNARITVMRKEASYC